MPRLPYNILHKARALDPLLPLLLKQCRDISAAQNELRWLRAHSDDKTHQNAKARHATLKRMVEERATGKPLQYILGTEFFGDLEIECRTGVLIPRQETAAFVTHLVQLLCRSKDLPEELRLIDLCTGTGCIPLLFQHELPVIRKDLRSRCLGVDISQKAVNLARHNLHGVKQGRPATKGSLVEFLRADVLTDPLEDQIPGSLSLIAALNFGRKPIFWDILVSNPPYISPSSYWKTTTRSVRAFEPKLALVPELREGFTDTEQGDAFYPRLLAIACDVEAKIVLLEVADLDQALRVANMARAKNVFDGIEIWRDQPDQIDFDRVPEDPRQGEDAFPAIIGTGNGRSVLCWRGKGATWLGKSTHSIKTSSVKVTQGTGQARLQPSFSLHNPQRTPDTE